MEYHAPTGQFTVAKKGLEYAAHSFLYAIANIRKMSDAPSTPYEQLGKLTPAELAQQRIINGAEALGINLGSTFCHEIDLSKFDS